MAARSRHRTAPVRGIVFDLDGTLVDGYEGIATGVNAARSAFGLPALAVEDVRRRVGHGLPQLMRDVVGAEHAAGGTAIFREVYEQVCEAQTRPAPALESTLSALTSRGVRLSIASNKPVEFSIRILERLGVSSYFAAIEGPETAGAVKPDPAMILACLRAMDVRRDEALYVGDMAIDAEAGARAGLDVVLVSGGSCSPDALFATGLPVLGGLAELIDLLGDAQPPIT
jgi:phosphoglycolate phosphatase